MVPCGLDYGVAYINIVVEEPGVVFIVVVTVVSIIILGINSLS